MFWLCRSIQEVFLTMTCCWTFQNTAFSLGSGVAWKLFCSSCNNPSKQTQISSCHGEGKGGEKSCFDYAQEKLSWYDSIPEIKTELRTTVEPQFLPLRTAFTAQSFTAHLYLFFPQNSHIHGMRWHSVKTAMWHLFSKWVLQKVADSRETEISRTAAGRLCSKEITSPHQPHMWCSHPTTTHCSMSPSALPTHTWACWPSLGLLSHHLSIQFLTSPAHPAPSPGYSLNVIAPQSLPLWQADIWWMSFPPQLPAACLALWTDFHRTMK